MNARDQIIGEIARAMSTRWETERLRNESDPELDAEAAFDAIPGRLLIEHLIETGVIVQTMKKVTVRREQLPGGLIRNHFATLFYLSEEAS